MQVISKICVDSCLILSFEQPDITLLDDINHENYILFHYNIPIYILMCKW